MFETIIFIDGGFVSKISNYFGDGKYLRYDLISFAENICLKENLLYKQIFYYTALPFQSEFPTETEEKKKEGYDKFIKQLKKRGVIVREGRCQRLKIDGKFEYSQKAVDILLAMDIMSVPLKYLEVRRIILLSTDSDFVPLIESLKEKGIKTILYTYYKKQRGVIFARSNYLIKSVHKYKLLTKKDFEDCPLEK